MPVTIYERPYQYIGPYPFSTSGTEPVQISGILIEQAQYALDCEMSGLTGGFPYTYYRILHPRQIPSYNHYNTYRASYSGINLGGPGDDPPCSFSLSSLSNIDRTRGRLLSVFINQGWTNWNSKNDGDWHSNDVRFDYFRQNFGDNMSGSQGHFRFSIEEEKSGIHDISVREISFQPYTRFSCSFRAGNNSTGFGGWVYSPIFPNCMTDAGELPYIKTTGTLLPDEMIASPSTFNGMGYLASGIEAINNEEMLIIGDMMFSGITQLRIGTEVLTCTRSEVRHGPQKDIPANCDVPHLTNGFGYFPLPASGSLDIGVYRAQLYQNTSEINGVFVVKSGLISSWPPYPEFNDFDSYNYENLQKYAFEVMKNGSYHDVVASGVKVISPWTNTPKFVKTADQTVSTVLSTEFKWSDIDNVSPTKNGTSIPVLYDIIQSGTGGWNPIFGLYDARTLDLVSATAPILTAMYGSPASEWGNGVHLFYIPTHNPTYTPSLPGISVANLAGKYVLVSTSGYCWVFSSTFENLGCFKQGETYASASSGYPMLYYDDTLWCQEQGTSDGFLTEVVLVYDSNKVSWPDTSSGMHIVGAVTNGESHRIRIMDPSGGAISLHHTSTWMADPAGTELDYGDGGILVNNFRLTPTTSGGIPVHLISSSVSGIDIYSGKNIGNGDYLSYIEKIT